MPYYEYKCRNEECGYVQTVKASEPLAGKALDNLLCEKCHSHMERKLSAFSIINGTEPPSNPSQSIDDKIFTIGKNKVFIGKKVKESPPIPLPCGHGYAIILLYEGEIKKQTELN
ncbi:MAG: zinc ribbon domain-containing protein [Candidatus Woesearchaeota archaeon]